LIRFCLAELLDFGVIGDCVESRTMSRRLLDRENESLSSPASRQSRALVPLEQSAFAVVQLLHHLLPIVTAHVIDVS
jgi:hypothetical protein